MDLYYSTGQVAEELNVTQDLIRRLCQAGVIKFELSPGGQLRIAKSEVERLKQTGLPPMPRPLPGARRRAPASGPATTTAGLCAPPSDALIHSAEQVILLGNEVKALRLQRRKEVELDHLRKREVRLQREGQEQEDAERARQSAIDAERSRQERLLTWEQFALGVVPADAPPELRLEVHAAVRTRLSDLEPLPADATCRQLVESIVGSAMRRSGSRKESQAVVQRVMRTLPLDIRYEPVYAQAKDEALHLMTEAVNQLPLDADPELKESVARRAAVPVLERYQHQKACEAVIASLTKLIPGASREERELGRREVTVALEQLPEGASQSSLEAVRDQAILPIQDAVRRRLDCERRQVDEVNRKRQEVSARSSAELRAMLTISHVDEALRIMEKQDELEFDSFADRANTSARLKERIRPELVESLVRTPAMTAAKLQERIVELMNVHLDSVLES